MKRLALITLIIIIFGGCDENQSLDELDDNQFFSLIIDRQDIFMDGVNLPIGTHVSLLERNKLIAVFPEQMKFVYLKDDSVMYSDYLTYKCTCTQSGGCIPFYIDSIGRFGCAQSNCFGECKGEKGIEVV